jgi:hypothetical protein
MKKIALSDYCSSHSQFAAAKVLGWTTQGAVWQALQRGREIYIVEHEDGSLSAYEVKHLAGRRVQTMPVVDEAA